MRRLDLTPLYKSSIGFDHLANVLDQLTNIDTETGFPPYNIERLGENVYRISMAVAGFGENDLSIEVKEGTLTVRGEKKNEDKVRQYIHQGIAARNFERRFRLADYVEVSAASLEHGLLHVDLKRELPEAMKPRTITITKGQPGPRVIEGAPPNPISRTPRNSGTDHRLRAGATSLPFLLSTRVNTAAVSTCGENLNWSKTARRDSVNPPDKMIAASRAKVTGLQDSMTTAPILEAANALHCASAPSLGGSAMAAEYTFSSMGPRGLRKRSRRTAFTGLIPLAPLAAPFSAAAAFALSSKAVTGVRFPQAKVKAPSPAKRSQTGPFGAFASASAWTAKAAMSLSQASTACRNETWGSMTFTSPVKTKGAAAKKTTSPFHTIRMMPTAESFSVSLATPDAGSRAPRCCNLGHSPRR